MHCVVCLALSVKRRATICCCTTSKGFGFTNAKEAIINRRVSTSINLQTLSKLSYFNCQDVLDSQVDVTVSMKKAADGRYKD